jgi:hypothetical protein
MWICEEIYINYYYYYFIELYFKNKKIFLFVNNRSNYQII